MKISHISRSIFILSDFFFSFAWIYFDSFVKKSDSD